ncbi:superoxide dismutase family protein [Streptomyces sp. NPDC000410]|uniref:superoxide dismutase family protein n=1 Tax=Streptomyces sp. NPDC000410 TaxID=3154254 RepID=UPI0033214558
MVAAVPAVVRAGVLTGVAALALLAAFPPGPGEQEGAGHAAHQPRTAQAAHAAHGTRTSPDAGLSLTTHAQFATPTALIPSPALTYDTTLVPAGARIEITQQSDLWGTTVRARLAGLKPSYAFGVHVHAAPCGTDPAAAGPHYRHAPDPGVSALNEVWLDFTSGPDGMATVETKHAWGFRRGEANSVVLHREQGGSGDRVACFTVPFGGSGVESAAGSSAAPEAGSAAGSGTR